MRFSLMELHNWGNVTKATLRLHTRSSTGPIHMYVQHLNATDWGNNGGTDLKWHTRPRHGQIISSFLAYTQLSNLVDVTEQVQTMMTMPLQAQKKIRHTPVSGGANHGSIWRSWSVAKVLLLGT